MNEPNPKAALARVIIAQASLTLAKQRVYECECDHSKGVTYARAKATVAADNLEAALADIAKLAGVTS